MKEKGRIADEVLMSQAPGPWDEIIFRGLKKQKRRGENIRGDYTEKPFP